MSDQSLENATLGWAIPGLTDGSLRGDQLATRINMLAKYRITAAEKPIATLLRDPDALVRERALIALIRYFRLETYWEDARRVMIEDELNAATGAALLGEIKDNTDDPVTLGVLAQVVLDAERSPTLRREAYLAIRAVRAYNPLEQFEMHFQTEGLEDLPVEWGKLRSYLTTPAIIAYTEDSLHQLAQGSFSEQETFSLLMRVGIARYQPAVPTLAKYLQHASGRVRGAALLGLIRYLRVQQYFPVALQMLLTDADNDTRAISARMLGEAYQNTQDPAMLHQLASVVANIQNAESVRLAAYMAMERIRAFNRSDWEGWFATDDPLRYIDQTFVQEALAM